MSSSQQQFSCLGVSLFCLGMLSLSACTGSQLSFTPNPVDSMANSIESTPTSTNANASKDNSTNVTATTTSQPQGTPAEQFAAIIGTQADGWLPKVLADKGLKKGLSPEATGKIIPGAEQVSEYGFSKVKVENIPGLRQYEFYYAKDSSNVLQLQSVKLHFDPALNAAYSDLLKALTSKYGAATTEDVEKQIIVWVGSEFVTAQLMKLTEMDGYELNISLAEE